MASPITYEQLSQWSGIPLEELLEHEKTTTTGRQRKFGSFDWEQLRQSTFLNGPTDIALTFVDYLNVKNRDAFRFEQLTPDTLRFIEEVERVSGVPVSFISTNFSWRNVIDRRAW
jgi:adenylosuccinate synthase